MSTFIKDRQYFKFCAYGFLKNLRFYDAFLLLFFLENGVSFSQIGILYAAREIIINIFEIPSGIIADTYGRKNSLIAAFLSYILSFLIFYISKDFYLLLLAILLNGIGDAFRSGTHKGMIMDYLKLNQWEDQKINYYGHTRSWSQRGSAVSALSAGFLVLYFGNYRLIYLFSVVPYLLNFINILTYPKAINYSLSQKKKQATPSFIAVFRNFLLSIKDKKVFKIINTTALHSTFLKAIKDYIQPVMVQLSVLIPIMGSLDIKRKSGLIIGILYFFIFLLTALASVAESVQDTVICSLLKEIWNTNNIGENFRPLALMVRQWNKETYEQLDRFPDPQMARAGCQLKEDLIDTTQDPILLATDLHAGNVLRAQRQRWLVIDIKPYIGDPAYDLTQHLLNGLERLTIDPSGTIQRLATSAGVNPSRLKKWMFARLASENGGLYQDIAKKIK